jgi:hypothetical protein
LTIILPEKELANKFFGINFISSKDKVAYGFTKALPVKGFDKFNLI